MSDTWRVTRFTVPLICAVADTARAQTLTGDLYLAAKASPMTYGVEGNADSHGPVAPTVVSTIAAQFSPASRRPQWRFLPSS